MIIPLGVHGSLWPLVPLAALFVIIFCCVFKAVEEMGMFQGPSKFAVAVCVSILAVWGIDRTIIWLILIEYQAMALTLLIVLLVLLLLWLFGRHRTRQEERRENSKDDSDTRSSRTAHLDSDRLRQLLDAQRHKTPEFPAFNKTLLSERYSPIEYSFQHLATRHGMIRAKDKPPSDQVEGVDRESGVNGSDVSLNMRSPLAGRFAGSSPLGIPKSKRPSAKCLREVDQQGK